MTALTSTDEPTETAVIDTETTAPPTEKLQLVLPWAKLSITDAATKIYTSAAKKGGRLLRRGLSPFRAVDRGDGVTLEELTAQSLRSAFDDVGTFVAVRESRNGVPVGAPTILSCDQANLLLGCADAVAKLPEIVGVVAVPILARTPDGPKMLRGGYSPETKLWVSGDLQVPTTVPVQEAVASILGLLSEYLFATPSDLSRAFASFLTPMLHFGNWLLGEPVPVDMAEANGSQTGKTHRQELVAGVYGDDTPAVAQKKGGPGGVDESVMALIAGGKPFIRLDNLRGKLDSPFLEMTLTNNTGKHNIRLPFKAPVEVRAKFLLYVSSNSLELTTDLANRSSIIRNVKRVGYTYLKNPKAEVEARREYYLGCVAAIIREWARLGMLRSPRVDHDFRAWASACDYIVQNIAGLDPLMDGHRAAQIRTNDPVQIFFREVAVAAERCHELGKDFSASQLIEFADDNGIELAGVDLRPTDDEAKEKSRRRLGQKLARIFEDDMSLHLDPYVVTRIEGVRERDDGGGMRPEKRYRFERKTIAAVGP
jgi:hypothetical protein